MILRDRALDWGLLLMRLGAGGLLLYKHGLPKLLAFSDRAATFSDPIGVGSTASLVLVIFAEVICSALVMLGLATRLAAVPVLIFFAVAVFIQQASDPWPKREFPLVFAIPFLTLLFTGPGRFSLDHWLGRKRGR